MGIDCHVCQGGCPQCHSAPIKEDSHRCHFEDYVVKKIFLEGWTDFYVCPTCDARVEKHYYDNVILKNKLQNIKDKLGEQEFLKLCGLKTDKVTILEKVMFWINSK